MTGAAKLALGVVVALAAVALAAPWLAADAPGALALHDVGPDAVDVNLRHATPGMPGRPLGADALGRDVFARLVHGLRPTLIAGFGGAALAGLVGLLWGAAAAARRVGRPLAWLADAASAFPPLFTATAAAALFRPSLLGLTLTLGALRAPFIARLVRQDARRAAAAPFVFAARASGARGAAIVLRHVVPHAAAPALVAAAFAVTGNVLAEAALSFLGVGLPEPTATLGGLLRDGRAAAPAAPHLVVIPGLVVVALTWSCHVLAETARRKLRPWTAEAPR